MIAQFLTRKYLPEKLIVCESLCITWQFTFSILTCWSKFHCLVLLMWAPHGRYISIWPSSMLRDQQHHLFLFPHFAGCPSIVHTLTYSTYSAHMHVKNLQVGLGMQRGSSLPPGCSCARTHGKHPLSDWVGSLSWDTAVVFCADNLLPKMPALCFCEKFQPYGPPCLEKLLSLCRL